MVKEYSFYLDGNRKGSHGGKREGAGRPALGTTRKVSITLSDYLWHCIDQYKENSGMTQSQILRTIIEGFFEDDDMGDKYLVDVEEDDSINE